jgi:hypothetical protein
MVRETRKLLARVRTLRCVLPSPRRVCKVVSRILFSSSGVNTLPWRFLRRIPVTAATPSLAKAAQGQNRRTAEVQLLGDRLVGHILVGQLESTVPG